MSELDGSGATIGGRYELLSKLGQGGMGAVYDAKHLATGRRVALKLISPELAEHPRVRSRFEIEARALAKIDSDHVAQVLDAGFDEARASPFLVMELMRGEDVEAVLKRVGPLAPEVAMRVFVQACRGLDRAHQVGIVHRDIKPANLFLAQVEDEQVRVKVLDFGIAKVIAPDDPDSGAISLVQSGMLVGSPVYMSPEQARGRGGVDQKSDLWSLSVVLYEMLCGQAPHEKTESLGDLIIAVCTEPSPPIRSFAPWVPEAIERLLMRALALDSDQRFQSAKDLIAAAKDLTGGKLELDLGAFVPADRSLPDVEKPAVAASHAAPSATLVDPALQSATAPVAASAPPPPAPSLSLSPKPASVPAPVAAPHSVVAGARPERHEDAEPPATRVMVLGALGVVIGAGVSLAIGLSVIGAARPTASAAPAGPDATASAAPNASTLSSAAAPSATAAAEVTASATATATVAPSATSSASAAVSSSAAASSSALRPVWSGTNVPPTATAPTAPPPTATATAPTATATAPPKPSTAPTIATPYDL